MPASAGSPFQYAVLRVVPRVDRGERINAGVVLFAPTVPFLGARVALDAERLTAIAPDADPTTLRRRLEGLAAVAAGVPEAGPMAALPASRRFHWLVAPSSTVIQPSAVHTGLCDDPESMLERLVDRLVR